MKQIIKRIHVKRQMKRKITNLCMLEISPRIYQNHHVSAVPVSTHYFALTVGFQSANGVGGLWGGRGWKTWKKNIAALLPNWLFALALLQYFFFSNNPLLFFSSFLLLLHLASLDCLLVYFLSFPVPHFSYIPLKRCVKWEDSGVLHETDVALWINQSKGSIATLAPHRSRRQSEPKKHLGKHKHLPENCRCWHGALRWVHL